MELTQKTPFRHSVKKMTVIVTTGSGSFNHVATLQSCIEIVIATRISGAQFKLHDTKQFNI